MAAANIVGKNIMHALNFVGVAFYFVDRRGLTQPYRGMYA